MVEPPAWGAPDSTELIYSVPDPGRAIDWILTEPSLPIFEGRVLRADSQFSDDAAVLAVIRRAE